MISYMIAGTLGVLNMILWGIYGDLLAEPFRFSKVFRSLFLGVAYGLFLFWIKSDLPLFIVALVVISMERITTEIYKAFLRVESQDKYLIPSDLGIRFTHPLVKKGIGLLLMTALVIAVWKVNLPNHLVALTLAVGFLVALGGSFKDARFEGFDLIKFFRTPLIAAFMGIIIWKLYPLLPGKYFLLAVAGGERIISECYKKILLGRIPGKFYQKNIDQHWRARRWFLLILYGLNLMGLGLLVFN